MSQGPLGWVPDLAQCRPLDRGPGARRDRLPDVPREQVLGAGRDSALGAGPCLSRFRPGLGARGRHWQDCPPDPSLAEYVRPSRHQEG